MHSAAAAFEVSLGRLPVFEAGELTSESEAIWKARVSIHGLKGCQARMGCIYSRTYMYHRVSLTVDLPSAAAPKTAMTPDKRQGRNTNEPGASDSLACIRCRERKIRCDRERPSCSNCERDEDALCVYQNPTKRVNHLKLLCDSVQQVQERLAGIEDQFAGLHVSMLKKASNDNNSSKCSRTDSSSSRSSSKSSSNSLARTESSTNERGSPRAPLVHRSTVEQIEHYHGPSSLIALCHDMRAQHSSSSSSSSSLEQVGEILQSMCEIAGHSESFALSTNQSAVGMITKDYATVVVHHFLADVDYTTDIFVPQRLMANVQRVYSEPSKPQDEAWETCLRAIALLVVGAEMGQQGSTTSNAFLFSGSARSLLPSRAGMVNSQLLTSPRLVNVQALILLSVAAQLLDPSGWAEQIFSYACNLAKTMGLYQSRRSDCHSWTDPDEAEEREKVTRALYVRDQSFCICRGGVSWLPRGAISSQLGSALDPDAPHSARYHLAGLQERCNWSYRDRIHGKSSLSKLRQVLQRLDHFALEYNLLDANALSRPSSALLALEFLTTRIVTLQNSTCDEHKQRVLADARASCVLLLIVDGHPNPSLLAAFNQLCPLPNGPARPRGGSSTPFNNTTSFPSILNAFSVPGFFHLLSSTMDLPYTDLCDPRLGISDVDLLRRVLSIFGARTSNMQPSCYLRKAYFIFGRLLSLHAVAKSTSQQGQGRVGIQPPAPEAPMLPPPSTTQPSASIAESMYDFDPSTTTDLTNLMFPSSPFSSLTAGWDHSFALPVDSSTEDSPHTKDCAGNQSTMNPYVLTGLLKSRSINLVSSQAPIQWTDANPDHGLPSERKRRRTQIDDPFSHVDRSMSILEDSGSFTLPAEIPFNLIS